VKNKDDRLIGLGHMVSGMDKKSNSPKDSKSDVAGFAGTFDF
jgi:hypothetical protein